MTLRLVHSAPTADRANLDARAYVAIRARPGSSYAALARELGVTERDAREAVARLVAAGRVADIGGAHA